MKTRITFESRCATIAAVLLCAVALAARGNTITVTNTNDSGPSSLRQVLADANDGDTITFAVTGAIVLTSGELLVDTSVTISGPGADNLAVDGNAQGRVFHIGSGKTVTVSGLTIRHGSVPLGSNGGGIYNDHATLTLSNCVISGNSGGSDGGGIFSDGSQSGSATVAISNSTLNGNSAQHGCRHLYRRL
jgi:hypothetical protein